MDVCVYLSIGMMYYICISLCVHSPYMYRHSEKYIFIYKGKCMCVRECMLFKDR